MSAKGFEQLVILGKRSSGQKFGVDGFVKQKRHLPEFTHVNLSSVAGIST